MKKFISLSIPYSKNPFKVTSLSFLGKLCNYWYSKAVYKRKRWKVKLVRALFIYLVRLGVKTYGTLEFRLRNKNILLNFDASNTQFCSLYSPQYKALYEPEVATILECLLPRDGVFYDIGANFGYFSLFVASLPDFNGKIYAFEPHPYTYRDLEYFVKNLNLNNTIIPQCLAISSISKEVFVKSSGLRSGNFTLADEGAADKNKHKVLVNRLDALHLPAADIIKVDTEGNEGEVLLGAVSLLEVKRPHIIFESTFSKGDLFKTMHPFQILEDKGYCFYYLGWKQAVGQDGNFMVRSFEDADSSKAQEIVLVLLQKEERSLYGERVNILAVHQEKLSDLEKLNYC